MAAFATSGQKSPKVTTVIEHVQDEASVVVELADVRLGRKPARAGAAPCRPSLACRRGVHVPGEDPGKRANLIEGGLRLRRTGVPGSRGRHGPVLHSWSRI